MDAAPLPVVEPTVVLVDSSPLIHLAMIDALDLLLCFGPVVIPDAVEIETTFDRTKPFADVIADWMDAHRRVGGANRWVDRPQTEVGELLKIAIELGRPRPRNVGEHAIVNWLADHGASFGGPSLVVYENGKIPSMLIREGLSDDTIVVTSHTFLGLAEKAGYLRDAAVRWATIEAADALGPRTAISEVILEARALYGRLPDQRDAFTENEYRRALALLGLNGPTAR